MDGDPIVEDALEAALAEFERLGQERFDRDYGGLNGSNLVVLDGRRFDADALGAAVAARVGIGRSSSEDLLARLGLDVVPATSWGVEHELSWRLDAWRVIQETGGLVSAAWLKSVRVYNAGQGIYVDKLRTRVLDDEGVAVAVRHTGRHYADDDDGHELVYRYPFTNRSPSRDGNEVQAVKNAMALGLPIFVSSDERTQRRVRLAWVVAYDDGAQAFLMRYGAAQPAPIELHGDEHRPFVASVRRSRRLAASSRTMRDPEFKFRLLRRYGGRCAITGVRVGAVLDAAHVIPVEKGGSDDERNGLLLTADLHRAFDANLWAIDPETLQVVTRLRGPQFEEIREGARAMRDGAVPPHPEAILWRFNEFKKAAKELQSD